MPPQLDCPACGQRLLGRRGPAVSVTGRCTCGARLGSPWQVEAGVCAAVGVVLLSGRPGLEVPAYLWFAVLGVVLSIVDAAARRLPNALTAAWAGGTLLGLAVPAVLADRGDAWLRAVACGLALAGFVAILAVVRPGGMGWGDVKAAVTVGMALGWLGWTAAYIGALLIFTLPAIYAMTLGVCGRPWRGIRVPMGPFMLASALIVAAWLSATGSSPG